MNPSPLPLSPLSPPAGPLTIWCNARFPDRAIARLREGTAAHRLVFPSGLQSSNLVAGGADPLLEQADIAFGQPDPDQSMRLPRLRWVHLTSAGYTRYDRTDLRDAFGRRGAILTNSSDVYQEPCAEHLLAMMLALARQLPPCVLEQHGDRAWRAAHHRVHSCLLSDQTALLLGFGAIGDRLAELLTPLGMTLIGVRRSVKGNERIKTYPVERTDEFLPLADHVVNILPAHPATDRFFDAMRFARCKRGAIFYNIGRGSTVDQTALLSALTNGKLAAAYLDVTDPEPLPKDHPLWTAPNCYITPHTAGGHSEEFDRLVEHFLENLDRFERGVPLKDRVV
jgi:phosphoglycerate dehydrogenase-like enzyme